MAAIRKEVVQEIVAEIRDMLELRADPPEAELQRLYKRYVSVVQTANSVLKRCLDLIEKGRKSDAIMRSDENNLLELVSILDFPEQHEWIAYVSQFGLSVPPAIDQFALRQINACYAPAQPLEPLYRLNRRHALANSPLRVRIGVMRRIEKMEEGSAREIAGRHLELFETERLKAVRKAAFEGQVLSVKEKLNQATFLTEVKTLKAQANSLNAKGNAEDNDVEQLITSIEQKQHEIQTQIDHHFVTALQEAAGEFETYKKQDTPDAESLQEFLTTFRGLAQEPEVSSELISVQAGPKALAMQCETLLFDLLDYASQVMHHYGGDA